MRYRTFAAALLAAALVTLIVWTQPLAAANRVALVIGNNAYQHAPALANPVNDARAVAGVLQAAGFEVMAHFDVDEGALEAAMEAFAARTAGADIGLVYYAGHGIQVEGTTYLVPIDISLERERDLRRLIPADYLLQDAARAGTLGLVILDACRDNPFVRRVAEAAGATRSMVVGRGLARITDLPGHTLIAYATQSGNIALDGTGSEHSPYAAALINHLTKPDTDVRLVFGAVRDDVVQATDRQQEPYTYGSLGGAPIFLNPSGGAATTQASMETQGATETISYIPAEQLEGSGSVDSSYAEWTAAISRDSWETVERMSARPNQDLFTHFAWLILGYRDAAAVHYSVARAFELVSDERLVLEAVDRAVAAAVQERLRDLNYYGGTIDGQIGPETRKALHAFIEERAGGVATYAALFQLAVAAATRQETNDLTGRWGGRYYYPQTVNGVSSVGFEMDLTFSQGRISGFVVEPNTFGEKTSANLYATFEGQVAGNEVSWTKTYDGTAGVSHSVRYEGTLDRQGRSINGRWIISEDWWGTFRITLR